MRRGVYPAAVTPMDALGAVDMPGVARLLAWFRSHGCEGVVLAGTNGEGPSLAAVEKRDLVRAAVPLAEEMEIVLGVATPSLEEAVWSCEQARKAGAAAALVMAPGYFREAEPEGVLGWFEALADRTSLPILIYNFPSRTGFAFTADQIARLGRRDGVIGLKDSSGDRANLAAYRDALGPEKVLYVGNETLLVEALDAGWTGTISGAANVVPQWLGRVIHELEGDRESSLVKFALLRPVLDALRTSPQPATNKALLHRLGVLASPTPRLPLLPADPAAVARAWECVEPLSTADQG